jgi:hypothetical protein
VAALVINIPGTSHERALDVCGCPSWIEHWRRHSGSTRKTCMAAGCDKEPEVGAHIRAHRGRTAFIIGLCRSCNHSSNNDHFEVDERSWWVAPNYHPGCGVLYDLEPGDIVKRSSTSEARLELIELQDGPADDKAVWLVLTPDGETRRVTLKGDSVRRIGSIRRK